MSYSATITIPAGTVTTNLTGFVTRVDLADLPVAWWTAVATDGHDIRVRQGGVDVPFDLVHIDRARRVGELFFRATLATATDNVFTIDQVDGATAPAATDPLGRNAVWVDFDAVLVFPSNTNRTGTGTAVDTGSVYATGPVAVSPPLTAHQGITRDDDGNFYAIDTGAIHKYDADWTSLLSNASALAATGIAGIDHLGDGTVHDGELYIVAEKYPNAPYNNQHVTVWDLDTLAFVRSYDISAQAREVSGLCFNADDGHFYVSSYITSGLDKYDTDFNWVSRLTFTTAITAAQAVDHHDGNFYVVSDSGDRILRVPPDGSTSTVIYSADLVVGGYPEGIEFAPNGDMWILWDNAAGTTSWAHRFERGFGNGRAGRKQLSGLTKRTAWTLGLSASLGAIQNNGQVMASYGLEAERSSLAARGTGSGAFFGIWNSVDSWLNASGSIASAEVSKRHRWHMVHNGTTNRTIWRDGVLGGTDTGVAARPSGTGVNLFLGGEDTTGQDRFVGWLNYAYLRNGVLTSAWLAAEAISWEDPSAFYDVTPDASAAVTATGALSMPSGAATLQTGSTLAAAGVVAMPTGSAQLTLDDVVEAAAVTVAGVLPTPTGAVAVGVGFAGDVTVAGVLAMPTGLLEVDVPPRTAVAPERGRGRIGTGVATWEPPVVVRPATVTPEHAVVMAAAWDDAVVTATGRVSLDGYTRVERRRHLDRIVIAGRDVTYFRGVRTPLPRFGLVSPLLWDAGDLDLPQVAAAFETPGRGRLAWLKEGAPVLVQRVAVEGSNAGKVIATDYRGIIVGFQHNGRALTVNLGGDATGRAALRDKQQPIFRRRNDLGWWWWHALAGPDGLRRPFGKVGGPTTGIKLNDTGGTTFAAHLAELAAKGTNLAGTQWTCMPLEAGDRKGEYRVKQKDRDTIHGTVYLDDARTVGALNADAAEQPNRIFGTGVTPSGIRARFGVYPVLALQQQARFPNYTDWSAIQPGAVDADTDTGGGVTALLARLSVTGYLDAEDFAGGYDSDVVRAVRDLQDDAGLIDTGAVDPVTWRALFDEDRIGYSTRGSRVEPIVQRNAVRRVRRNASGQIIGTNPGWDPTRLVVDRTIDFGTGVTRKQMRQWSRGELHNERHWTGTITFHTGALIDGEHNPGDPLTGGDLMPARALRPGMNLWLPLFDGGTLVHVSGVDVDERTVRAAVDTRARDTMTVWEVIERNQASRRQTARSWIRDHRSSGFVKDAVTEADENVGLILDTPLDAGWNVFPVVAGQEGTIARLRMRVGAAWDEPCEFVVGIFGRRVGRKRLTQLVGNPLTKAGSKRWEDEQVQARLDADVLLYVAGSDEQPCGYYPKQKAVDGEDGGPLTGRWDDDAGFGYRTFDQSCVLWVAVYAAKATTLAGGRIMWPQLEPGS